MKIWISIGGWLTPAARGKWLVLGLVAALPLGEAVSRETDPLPDQEMLEFLGSWQTQDGEWVDPFHLDDFPLLDSGTNWASAPSSDRTIKDGGRSDRSLREQGLGSGSKGDPRRRRPERRGHE